MGSLGSVSEQICRGNFVYFSVKWGYRIVGTIARVEVIARGLGVRELSRLSVRYGPGRWRKLKGVAFVEIRSGTIVRAEVHWYEAHGIGIRELKIKRLLD